MTKDKDILSDASMKANPFTAPEGYALELESRVHGRISAEDAPPATFWGRAKAPVMLALTFVIIFGMGYGVLALTGTAGLKSDLPTASMSEVQYIWPQSSTFIEDYYDEMDSDDVLEHSLKNIEMTQELESEIMGYITMNDIMNSGL